MDPPLYNRHWELGISIDKERQDPIILNLLKVIQERNRCVNHHPVLDDVHTNIHDKQCPPPAGSDIISVHSSQANAIDSTNNSIPPTSSESVENLAHCWT